MGYKHDKLHDRMVGHDPLTGDFSSDFHQFVLDEMELGARVAIMINDPEQWWWEIYHDKIQEDLSKQVSI